MKEFFYGHRKNGESSRNTSLYNYLGKIDKIVGTTIESIIRSAILEMSA